MVDQERAQDILAIDLFCGAGGLSRGLEEAGIRVKLGIDTDPACEYPFSANNKAKFLLKSVEDLSGDELNDAFGNNGIRLLAGCAPCQTFSSYNPKADSSDKRWWLLLQFSRLIKVAEPELVMTENVPGLMNQDVFKEFVDDLEERNYHVDYKVVNCADFGVPQTRKRLVLLASRLGTIRMLSPAEARRKKVTVRDAIGDLPPLLAGQSNDKDRLHVCSTLSELNTKRIQASKPGGTWRDWDKGLVADCHKKGAGKNYSGVYGRMRWDEPSPTITTKFFGFGSGRFGHPQQDRAISLREGAILQSFPKWYKFVGPGEPVYNKTIGRLIGNAVPVKLGVAIGKTIVKHIEGELLCT